MGVTPSPQKHTTVFLDVDDTLFPTTQFKDKYGVPRPGTKLPVLDMQDTLAMMACDQAAAAFIRAAQCRGTVYLVSSACKRWLEDVLLTYLPTVSAAGPYVVSSREEFRNLHATSQQKKALAFKGILRQAQIASPVMPVPRVYDLIVSVGDMEADAWAAERLVRDNILFPTTIPTVRTVLGMPAPTFGELQGQWMTLLQHQDTLLRAPNVEHDTWQPVTRMSLRPPPPAAPCSEASPAATA